MGADLLAYYNTLSIKCQTKIYVTNIQRTNTRKLLRLWHVVKTYFAFACTYGPQKIICAYPNGKLREIQKLRRTLSAAPSILLPALEKMHNALAT